ncbi:MAG: hypothetical protein KGL68_08500 [Burkholderiales bacterium]|nr:hypothetical protein [Burkholderiales bacterium]
MDNPVYHVLLDGRRIGPYDRRTIVGMKVKKALSSQSVLVGADGTELTVGELVRQGQPQDGSGAIPPGAPGGGSYSVVQGIHAARLLEVEGRGFKVPPFKGEVEVRVQTKALRVSGRWREGLAWKEDRVKFPLPDIAHARLRGTVVDLWIRTAGASGTQRISLDLLKPEAAGELAESLPHTAPYPGSEPLAGRTRRRSGSLHPMLWAIIVGSMVVVAGLLVWTLARR